MKVAKIISYNIPYLANLRVLAYLDNIRLFLLDSKPKPTKSYIFFLEEN